jgi:hypothetical protein
MLRAVQPAALARATSPCTTSVASGTTSTAVKEHLQALQWKVLRYFQANLTTYGSSLAITSV